MGHSWRRFCLFLVASVTAAHGAISSVSDSFQIDGPLVADPIEKYFGQVAAASNCFLFAWLDAREGVYGARIELDGTTTNTVGTRLSGVVDGRFPEFDLASDGDTFLAVWRSILATNAGIRGTLIDNNGNPLPGELLISTNVDAQSVVVTAYGSGYFVAWLEPVGNYQAIRGARITTAGQALDTNGFLITQYTWVNKPIQVAGHGETVLIGYSKAISYPPNVSDAWAVLVTLGEQVRVGQPFAVSSEPSPQEVEAIAWWRDQFLVVWSTISEGSFQNTLRGSFVDSLGRVFTAPLNYTESDQDFSISHVTLAVTSTGGVLGWRSDWIGSRRPSEWRSTELTSNAVAIITSPFPVLPDLPVIDIASGLNYYPSSWPHELAATGDTLFLNRNARSYFVRTAQGTLVTNENFIKSTPNQTDAAIASNGREYFVVWADSRCLTNWYLFGRRFTTNGEPLEADAFLIDSHPIYMINPGAEGDNWIGKPAIASCRRDYLFLMLVKYHHIYGKRILRDGTVLDGYLELTETATASQPSIAANRQCYLAVWSSYSNERAGDIQARLISADGRLGPVLLLEDTEADATAPLVGSSGHDFLVVWNERSGFYTSISGAIVSSSGKIQKLDRLSIPFGYSSALAGNVNGYIRLATISPFYVEEQVFATPIRRSSTILAGFGIATNTDQTLWSPSLAANGTRAFAAWHENNSSLTSIVSAAEFRLDGKVFPRTIGTIPANQGYGMTTVSMAGQTSMLVTESWGMSGRKTLSGHIVHFR